MWLLDVRAVLDRDDIRKAQRKTKALQQFDAETAKYAILSHRWGTEIDYDDMNRFMTMDEKDGVEISECDGYQKIIRSCEQAQEDGYCWMWIDTCCIDKRSSAELSEAINSMYRWYHNAQRCYVYLSDVEQSVFPAEQDFGRFVTSNGWPEWFSRGWTLQELIAPKEVTFFNKGWVSLGTKRDLTSTLEIITRIPHEVFRDEEVLRGSDPSKRPSVAQIMSWAADRETTRVEDRAYSLLGLFGVNMPMLYGEGSKAFERLQLEIIRVSSDHSIFAWNTKGQFQEYGTILADDPSCFRGCHDIVKVTPEEFSKRLRKQLNENQLDADTQCGKCISLCNSTGMDSPRLLRFDVTNLGIHVSLPVLSLGDNDSPRLRTILPCCDRFGNLITIDLDSRGLSSCYRSLHAGHDEYHACPEFRSLYLACFRNSKQSGYRLRLDDRGTCQFGFTRCGTFPRKIANDEVVLSSQGNTFIVVVYASNAFISRFAVGLGYHLGQLWARVFCDDCAASQEARVPWAGFAKQAYDIMWNAPIHTFCRIPDTTEDVHLPRSIYDVRIVCGSGAGSDTDLKIDIERCPGCCGGPRKYVVGTFSIYTFQSNYPCNHSWQPNHGPCGNREEAVQGCWSWMGDR
ncbi:heterokaryon incompatibility protein-domain-containing protein [Pisolithus sp. B1]|nr:heterokaryon incompatibility protein-domain-containing protein [Pisolithus sp. B1]